MVVDKNFVNVTLDIGAAINAERVLWNYPVKFKNVLIHLGDFHFMKENFGVIGNIGVWSTGSLNGVLTGCHYKRVWTVHRVFSEALERCLNTTFPFQKILLLQQNYHNHFMRM